MATKKQDEQGTQSVTVSAPNIKQAIFHIEGKDGSPLVYQRFSRRTQEEMIKAQEAGGTAKSKRKREAKNFTSLFEEATYRDRNDGWFGLNATGIRNALVGACRLVNFKMTVAKLSIDVIPDGWDEDATPLVRIYGERKMFTTNTRNASGVMDLRARPRWDEWRMAVRLQWDGDQFTAADVTNLLMRVGLQCGLGAGRPNSKDSCGMGWGLFRIVPAEELGSKTRKQAA